jgi:hypothetical protein
VCVLCITCITSCSAADANEGRRPLWAAAWGPAEVAVHPAPCIDPPKILIDVDVQSSLVRWCWDTGSDWISVWSNGAGSREPHDLT